MQGGNSVVSLGTSGGNRLRLDRPRGHGSYTLNGGTLAAYSSFLDVGDLAGGSGTLNVNGGVATVSGALYVGNNGGNGTLSINPGGILNYSNGFSVGYGGRARASSP